MVGVDKVNVYFTECFRECYNSLPEPTRKKANKALFTWVDDFWNPSIRARKTKGLLFQEKDIWSISMDPNYKIRFFVRNNGKDYYLVDICPWDSTIEK